MYPACSRNITRRFAECERRVSGLAAELNDVPSAAGLPARIARFHRRGIVAVVGAMRSTGQHGEERLGVAVLSLRQREGVVRHRRPVGQ